MNPEPPRGPNSITLLAALLLTLILLAVAIAPSRADSSDPAVVCFSAEAWSANDNDRPCVLIRLYEDGTFRHKVRQADGDRWISR